MRSMSPWALTLAAALAPGTVTAAPPPPAETVLAAHAALDGRGKMLRDVEIVVRDGRIATLRPATGAVDYDLRALTVMPGWIDAHTHITWSFGGDGRNAGSDGTALADAYRAAANAQATLLAGFTTIQSVGSPTDVPLRDAIAAGLVPGPRLLTAVEPLEGRGPETGTPEEIRAFVRKQKEAGADLIKIFASQSIRLGGAMTLSQEQLDAACDEARKLGLRTLVHAYKEAVRAAALAGCSQVEHGTLASDEDLRALAAHGTYLDPQAGLVIENYLRHRAQYLGTPGYTAEGFAAMERILPMNHDLVRRASAIPGLKVVFGTDAVAGAHGENAEEFIDRVRDAGIAPLTVLTSAQSLGAEAAGLGERLGTLAPGYEADIIALDGDPLGDITAVRRVVFVMKAGKVYKDATHSWRRRAPAETRP
jgi:imidazolonepropionase-like amidohydrolase